MTPERLAAIKARAEAASAGVWPIVISEEGLLILCRDDFKWACLPFLEHARADVPALLAEVERLRVWLESLKAGLDLEGHWAGRAIGTALAGGVPDDAGP